MKESSATDLKKKMVLQGNRSPKVEKAKQDVSTKGI